MKIAVIGAGPAGLSAGRFCAKEGYEFNIFEQTGNIGGTWVYTDQTEFDEYGLPIHSAMYQGLRTNLPKELMEYENFKYPELEKSFISQEEVLKYIKSFSKEYSLESYIQFYKHVIKVDALEDNKWLIQVQDVKDKSKKTYYYDAVIICNGHYNHPIMPNIKGLENFTGKYKHSHKYRRVEYYKDKTLLIVGAGPSGLDILRQTAPVAKKVLISHKGEPFGLIPATIIQKPTIKEINGDDIIFEDGTIEQVDEILFCTGYKYSYPFLTNHCKISVDDNWVHPLYKHVINIEKPTLAFIGIPFTICPFPMFDLQVRFFLATLSGHFLLPSKKEMMEDLEKDLALRKHLGLPLHHAHKIGTYQEQYFNDLAKTANISPVVPVINKMYMSVVEKRNFDIRYKVIDDENYIEL